MFHYFLFNAPLIFLRSFTARLPYGQLVVRRKRQRGFGGKYREPQRARDRDAGGAAAPDRGAACCTPAPAPAPWLRSGLAVLQQNSAPARPPAEQVSG